MAECQALDLIGAIRRARRSYGNALIGPPDQRVPVGQCRETVSSAAEFHMVVALPPGTTLNANVTGLPALSLAMIFPRLTVCGPGSEDGGLGTAGDRRGIADHDGSTIRAESCRGRNQFSVGFQMRPKHPGGGVRDACDVLGFMGEQGRCIRAERRSNDGSAMKHGLSDRSTV